MWGELLNLVGILLAAIDWGFQLPPTQTQSAECGMTAQLHDIHLRNGNEGSARPLLPGQTVTSVGDIPYTTSIEDAITLTFARELLGFRPATVVNVGKSNVSSEWLSQKLHDLLLANDVLTRDFFTTLVVYSTSPDFTVPSEVVASVAAQNYSLFWIQNDPACLTEIHEGPHFLTQTSLTPALRIYCDTQNAFLILPEIALSGVFGIGKGIINQYISGMIAVPSRLASPVTLSKPLAGLRIAVKDVIDVVGHCTGASNGAFASFYPPKIASAPVVQRLLDLGAIVIGKTKTTQFALGEEPTADWVDYHCPFNPRGDGYQTTEGSSAGSAAAVAAYDWLDLTLGTDTSGSIRLPAAFQGVFGLRPSTNQLSRVGIVEVTSAFDTPGYLSRDMSIISQVMQLTQNASCHDFESWEKPTRLIYPLDHFPFPNKAADDMIEEFIVKFETYLGVKRTRVNLDHLWIQGNPAGTLNTISQYLNLTTSALLSSGSRLAQSQFVREYQAKHGKAPFISPLVRWTWEYAASLSQSAIDSATQSKAKYKQWVSEKLLPRSSATCSEAIMVFPFGDPEPRYRDTYRDPPSYAGFSWRADFHSPMAELPDLIIPIGQYAYESPITKVTEYLPVSIAVVASSGCDVMLVKLVEDMLRATGTPATVLTGREAFLKAEHTIQVQNGN